MAVDPQNGVIISRVGNSYQVAKPGFEVSAQASKRHKKRSVLIEPAAEYVVYFTQVQGGHIVTVQDVGRSYVRIGPLDEDFKMTGEGDDMMNPIVVTSGEDEARKVAIQKALGLAKKLLP